MAEHSAQVSSKEISHQSLHFVNTHFPTLNHCFQAENHSYQILNETIIATQNGVWHFLHLLGKEDRKLYTITFSQQNGHNRLVEYAHGHLPHQRGYGTTYDKHHSQKQEHIEHLPHHH